MMICDIISLSTLALIVTRIEPTSSQSSSDARDILADIERLQIPICETDVEGKLSPLKLCVHIPENLRPTAVPTTAQPESSISIPEDTVSKDASSKRKDDAEVDAVDQQELVPPFLIGASSVIVIYVFAHCLYIHCYAKRKIRQIKEKKKVPPLIILNDDGLSSSSRLTPMAKLEAGDGRIEEIETMPFIFYQPEDVPKSIPHHKRNSMLSVSSFLKSGFSRTSLKSDCSTSNAHAEDNQQDRSGRARLCFVPIMRSISDPSGVKEVQDATPMEGYLYPSLMVPHCASFRSIYSEGLPSSASVMFVHKEAANKRASCNLEHSDLRATGTGSPLGTDDSKVKDKVTITITPAEEQSENDDSEKINLNIY